ncbi:biotin transport system substrate-specific component [Halalkalibacter nanhaiisediminis]|uniref:Biotin transport system substrate-specific component n=1 Tax=Halalkalibacter nanhaiisediminis TaxID=688079 RepID=A0A562Q9T5_9BACI|nr:biotin transport system substrate-specific component [Halalkalibacter nanhaiisediminis]
MTIYLLVGLIGFSVFAKFKGGLSTFISPIFGFLVAFVTGLIIEKSKQKSLKTFMIACFVGLIIIYMFGTHYMYFAFQILTGLKQLATNLCGVGWQPR